MTRSRTRIIAVAGGSGSGKTTFVGFLKEAIEKAPYHLACDVLSQDHYYIDQSARFQGDGENVNFDHPDALDFPLLALHLAALRKGLSAEVPIYDFVTHKRLFETQTFPSLPVIVLDGTLILTQAEIREQVDVSVFIDTPEEIRFQRRLHRDVVERGRTREGVLKQFSRQVKPMHDAFVEPSKVYATHLISGIESFEPRISNWIGKLLT